MPAQANLYSSDCPLCYPAKQEGELLTYMDLCVSFDSARRFSCEIFVKGDWV